MMEMDEHRKKMMAPVIITVVMVLYYVVYFGLAMAVRRCWTSARRGSISGVIWTAFGTFPWTICGSIWTS